MINSELRLYIENNILPQYALNDKGHSAEHIEYVTRRSLLFAEQFESIDINMVYVIASYHDIAHHIDKKIHEQLSAEIFYSDEEMKKYFTDSQRITIRQAIEDHRASLETEPRSDYGKIISSADRSTDADEFLRRTHAYTLRYFPGCSETEALGRGYEHTSQKYGKEGYAKHYVRDEEYEKFRADIENLISDRGAFDRRYREVNRLPLNE